MAGPKKKRNENSENSDNSDSEPMEIGQVITADFEGRNPDQGDFHGIKQLLKQLFLKSHIDISEICDIIIDQVGLGSVLKQALDEEIEDCEDDFEDNTVFGVTTVLNLTENSHKESIKQLLGLLKELIEKYCDENCQEKMFGILNSDKKLGLILNERFLNIPMKIADPLLGSLQSEIERFSKKNPNYNFDYFIMISKTYKDQKEQTFQFVNPEEEIFSKNSEFSFEFCVENESDSKVEGTWNEDEKNLLPYRKVIIFSAKNLPKIIQSVKKYVA